MCQLLRKQLFLRHFLLFLKVHGYLILNHQHLCEVHMICQELNNSRIKWSDCLLWSNLLLHFDQPPHSLSLRRVSPLMMVHRESFHMGCNGGQQLCILELNFQIDEYGIHEGLVLILWIVRIFCILNKNVAIQNELLQMLFNFILDSTHRSLF